MKKKVRAIAFYLPQFHPVEVNDKYWGKGFTEWTNVKKANQLFNGHHQPKVPGELGYYDLRDESVREAQAKLAKDAGIEGFCYWHYWFGNGVRVLERIFDEVVSSGKPNLPFCLGWANESWSGRWHGAGDQILLEQTYPGEDDYRKHFECILPALKDSRYIEVEGKKVFVIYRPDLIPDLEKFISLWQQWGQEEGIKGFYFISNTSDYDISNTNLNARMFNPPYGYMMRFKYTPLERVLNWITKIFLRTRINDYFIESTKRPFVKTYKRYEKFFERHKLVDQELPVIVPNWDNTPRCGTRGVVLTGSTPELFRNVLKIAIGLVSGKLIDERLVFIKSWNEWAEGNYLEPDEEWERKYLDVCRDEIFCSEKSDKDSI
jgi:hypothetical protein